MNTAEHVASAPESNPAEDTKEGGATPDEEMAQMREEIHAMKAMMEKILESMGAPPAESQEAPMTKTAIASEDVTKNVQVSELQAAFNRQQEVIDSLRKSIDSPERRSNVTATPKSSFDSARANFGKWYLAQRGVRTGEIEKDAQGNWYTTGGSKA